MIQTIAIKKSVCLSVCLLSVTISLAVLACSHSTSSSLREESEVLESEIISVRNPSIVIGPPTAVTFAWLPESVNDYNDPGLDVRETIQEAITESLAENGYEYDNKIDRINRGTGIPPEDLVLVKSWKWTGGNFGGGGFLEEITLDNRSSRNLRDLKVRIDYTGTTGPKEGVLGPASVFFIHDLLPAKTVKTFKEVSVGFRHSGGRGESISILSVKTITDELLIGYALALENELSDEGLNSTHNIAAGGLGSNGRINEYEKGTVIIDVVDAKTRKLIWRGALQALASSDIQEDTKLNRIKLVVEKLVDSFVTSNQ